MANNLISTPSFGAALSVMRKSFNTNNFQFNLNNQDLPAPKSEQEIITSLALTNSIDNISQDPSLRPALEIKQPSNYIGNIENENNEASPVKAGDSTPEAKKFSEIRDKKMVNQPGGDENSDVVPDEPREVSSPLQLIRLESIFGKDTYLSPIRSHVQNSIVMDQQDPKDASNTENKVIVLNKVTSKENAFKKSLRRLKGVFLGKVLKQGTIKQEGNETNMNITIQRSEIQKSQPSFSVWSPDGDPDKFDNETRRIGKDPEEEKMGSASPSIRIIGEDVTSPKKLNRSRLADSGSGSRLDEGVREKAHINIIGTFVEDIQLKTQRSFDLSQGNSPYSPNRSPNSRRRASFGQNLQQVQEKTVQQAFKWSRAIALVLQIAVLILFLIIIYIALGLLSSVITYPFQKWALHLWVGQFLHGFFLGILSFRILKIMIRISREMVRKEEEKALGKGARGGEVNHDGDINLFGFLLLVTSGFLMVLLAYAVDTAWFNAFCFVGLEIVVLIINAILMTLFFVFKNYHDSRVLQQDKQKQGFFFVPIYKHFMSDLKHTRNDLANNPEALSPSSRSNQEKKSDLKEEGIDKFKPKRPFEIVTVARVAISQTILIILYIQFLVVIGFVKLYDLAQEADLIIPAIPIVLVYPLVMYWFYKLLKFIDHRKKMGILFHTSYINTALAVIFFRAVVLHIQSYGFMWLIIGSKIGYKLLVYVVYGCNIPFWKDAIEKAKQRLNKKNEYMQRAGSVLRPFSQATVIELSRIDTITSKQMREMEKQEDSKKTKVENKTIAFVLRFVLVQTNEIVYNISSLFIFACYTWRGTDYASILLDKPVTDMYVTATWIELLFEVGLLVAVAVCWTFNKGYNFLKIRQVFKYFFMNFAIDFVIISLPLLTSYLFLLRL